MRISYFRNDKSEKSNWDSITRDERFFCSELFHNLRSDQTGFLSLIKEGINEEKFKTEKNIALNNNRFNFLKNIENKEFDIGFEVCFYRDMLFLYKDKYNEYKMSGARNEECLKFSLKRTFDLAFFSEEAIIIVEAKAQQGFDTKQLTEFKRDHKCIEKLFKIIGKKMPEVYIVGLHSGNYTPGSKTIKVFDSTVQWDDTAEKYPKSKELFNYANHIYRN